MQNSRAMNRDEKQRHQEHHPLATSLRTAAVRHALGNQAMCTFGIEEKSLHSSLIQMQRTLFSLVLFVASAFAETVSLSA
jgi:hypothetical protein